MKNRYTFFLILVLTPGLAITPLLGHGLGIAVNQSGDILIATPHYHNSSRPIPDARVMICFQTPDNPFQTGRTDQNGNFCFQPRESGTYLVTVDDGFGHQHTIETVYPLSGSTPQTSHGEGTTGDRAPETTPRDNTESSWFSSVCPLLLGISLILFFTLLAYVVRRKT